jgi:hypothetical protein
LGQDGACFLAGLILHVLYAEQEKTLERVC